MIIDQVSLFIAAGICCSALALTMLSAWAHNRSDRFLIGWMTGMLLLGMGVIVYMTIPPTDLAVVATAFTMETLGFIVILVSARMFIGRPTSYLAILGLGLAVPLVAVPILVGFDGFGIMLYNFFAGMLLIATGLQYWNARAEAPSSIAALTVLYSLSGVSFIACGVALAADGNWSLGHRPDNWAEQFNAIMCISGITGIGALSLGLNHARAARRHREEARTDGLTGLLNRRALFDTMSSQPLFAGTAVIAFDLDRFKAINDRYGHAVGDEVLRRFAIAMRSNLRDSDHAARTGGEEFVLVLPAATLPQATATAERVRATFSQTPLETPKGRLWVTASAGVAIATEGEAFEDVLHRADTSLYRAKDTGRDRVVTELQSVA